MKTLWGHTGHPEIECEHPQSLGDYFQSQDECKAYLVRANLSLNNVVGSDRL